MPWTGKVTPELRELARKYEKEMGGERVDGYDEVCYEAMTYEEFEGYIKTALERHCSIVDVVWEGYD